MDSSSFILSDISKLSPFCRPFSPSYEIVSIPTMIVNAYPRDPVPQREYFLQIKLQGALVVYDYERNVCIESIYKTLREEGRRGREQGNIGELYRDSVPTSNQ